MSVRVGNKINEVIQELRGRQFEETDAVWLCSQLQYCIDRIRLNTVRNPPRTEPEQPKLIADKL